jgi:type III restriction enzyme
MKQIVIANPIINSPFDEPKRHFRFTDQGITNEIVEERRSSAYFIPIAKTKKKGKQLILDTEWTQDRVEQNRFVNDIRERVAIWRRTGKSGITTTTRSLLDYWSDPDRERKLFFCQIEALETLIYIVEVASKHGDPWIANELRKANETSNPGLPRLASKMATGSGKTVVMAMIIAWQALNKVANPQDMRFSDAFLAITPGITIRDRLRVLLPNDPDTYYRKLNLVTGEQLEQLQRCKIVITNFHTLQLRETIKAPKVTKTILSNGSNSTFTETPNQMVRRVCRELGNKKNIVILNDEAHHCYRKKPEDVNEKLKGDDRREAEKRNAAAHLWISGVEAVKSKIGVRTIYDLSATPFFLRGSGWPEGTLFPWVVSDFSLIDAIESGIVKVPRVPVADDSMIGDQPTYRDLWIRIREQLPRKGRATEAVTGEPKLPKELEGALHSLYSNYRGYYAKWEENIEARAKGITAPVFIVVCSNTNVSKLVYDYIAGWEKPIGNTTVVQAGALPIFRNDDGRGGWLHRPNTILVDSEQLESGEAMSDDFKKVAAREIEEFKSEYRARFPGRDTEKLTDEDLLREVMNTVGKPGRLGEHVKCVISVSMLTEGWDANTVTHILGVRAFGTQLLCEQVVGRGLRRRSYATHNQTLNLNGDPLRFEAFPAEYAEVYGVPFSFIPTSGSTIDPPPGPVPTRVRALEERSDCEVTFPRVTGYRYDIPDETLHVRFSEVSDLPLSSADLPTRVDLDPIVGERSIHTLDDLRRHRENEVAFVLARRTLEKYFRDDEGNDRPWLFPQLLKISKDWMVECLKLKDNTFPQLLLLAEFSHDAADRMYKSIVGGQNGARTLKPILQPYDTVGSTRYVDFDTIRPTYATREDKCHISHVVAHTESWEQKLAETLEDMDEVVRYVKNERLYFTIPYTMNGEEHKYTPDFIAVIDDGHGRDALLNLIIEVSGEAKKDKAAKVSTAKTLWVPAINNHGGFGHWEFVEVRDPWAAKAEIRNALNLSL